ncbi:MAG TPA: c-type cytochrome, partial [Longimicrobiales bacterium]|nr:c-type cytochrome [Longimicrobiales bacterium]
MTSRRRLRTLGAVAALALVAGACDPSAVPVGMARGAELYDTCQPCHGDSGEGNPDIQAPAIAGLPQWYIESQLESFQAGWRGKHAEDLGGLRMRPMAVSLNHEGDIPSVAEYVAQLEAPFPASTLHGNAGAGAAQYEQVCVACHGPNGMGNEALRSPPIVQLQDGYLVQEREDFRSGARGAHPQDTWGMTMRVNAALLSDEA